MGYCLARHDLWPMNLICDDVADYIRQEQERHLGEDSFPLQKYLHHGLSSQAMAFNLIGPLIVRNDLGPLKIAIERLGIDWPGGDVAAVFEHDDRSVFNEDNGQPTSIDIILSGTCNSLFIEAKLVEREFGGCSVLPVVIARVGIRIQTGLANVTCTISAGNIGSAWMGLAFRRRLLLMGPYVRLQTTTNFSVRRCLPLPSKGPSYCCTMQETRLFEVNG